MEEQIREKKITMKMNPFDNLSNDSKSSSNKHEDEEDDYYDDDDEIRN